jgi:two-component system nitrogen regulation response regulator GlnG
MQEVFKRIALVVGTDLPVLITGESGTGKELVARAIHRHSSRADKPFLAVHLAALSPTLIESELFGHVKGAFTGADTSRQGILELAHEATLFFDEAGDIPPQVQVKLLRVLEQREVSPVGDVRVRPADFRLIAATNRNLDAALADGSFRQDFYYRIAGLDIRLPPLRERQDDIPLLAEHFLKSARVPLTPQAGFSGEALAELRRRPWPGNIRELRNAVEHAALLARGGLIEPAHLPPARMLGEANASGERTLIDAVKAWTQQRSAHPENAGHLYDQFLAEAEPALFETILAQTNGNRTAAAELLGIDRATLRRRLT